MLKGVEVGMGEGHALYRNVIVDSVITGVTTYLEGLAANPKRFEADNPGRTFGAIALPWQPAFVTFKTAASAAVAEAATGRARFTASLSWTT